MPELGKRNRIGMDLSQLESLAAKYESAGGKLKDLAEGCLTAAHEAVTPDLKKDIKKHNRTGKTEASIVEDAKVEWEGTRGSIPIGFKISDGGLPSVFLMYGTPRIKKDTKLHSDIYGSKAKKKIVKAQEEVFQKGIKKLLGE